MPTAKFSTTELLANAHQDIKAIQKLAVFHQLILAIQIHAVSMRFANWIMVIRFAIARKDSQEIHLRIAVSTK